MALEKEYLHEMATLGYEDYYKRNKERIASSCGSEFLRLRTYSVCDDLQWIEPETVGRIMANMFHADVWAVVAMALKLTADDAIREDLYAAIQKQRLQRMRNTEE